MADDPLAWAVSSFKPQPRLARYELARAYYLGDHPLNFAEKRFNDVFKSMFQAVSDNLCPAIVDAVADRLELISFTSNATVTRTATDELGAETEETHDPLADEAWDVWQRNRMDLRAAEVHRESLITGDGYVIVWPNQKLEATIWPQYAHEMAINYDPDYPDLITTAAKMWKRDDKRLRINLYFSDRIERYISRGRSTGMLTSTAKPDTFVRYSDGDSPSTITNPYGRVPVFHFPNRRCTGYGLSELLDVMPLQDALNKTLADQLVAQEFAAYRQRWVTGLEIEIDDATGKPKPPPWDHGADKFFADSNPETRFGEFGEANLTQYIEVEENLRAEMARVSGTPLHYLFITKGDFPSGEAMKSAEARFTSKLKRAETTFGNVWEDCLEFALEIDGAELPDGFQLSGTWDNPAPRSEKELAETAVQEKAAGVPLKWRLRRMGFTEKDIAEMLADQDPAPPTPVVVPPPSPQPTGVNED